MSRGHQARLARELGVSAQRVSQVMAKARGLCSQCYQPRKRPGALCQPCLAKQRTYQAAKYHAKRKAAGQKSKITRCSHCCRLGHNIQRHRD